jgi:outer membrane protein OmpA-like peptidoglycan-associated protein
MEILNMKWFGCVLSAAFIGALMAPAAPASAQGMSIKDRLAAQRAGVSSKGAARQETTRGFAVIKKGTVQPSTSSAASASTTAPAAKAPASTGVSVTATAPAPKAAVATQQTASTSGITSDAPVAQTASARQVATRDSEGKAITVNVFTNDAGLDISKPVRFEYNSAFLTDDGRQVLSVYCSAIQEFESENADSGASYVLIGHADASGDARYNQVLSQKRAEESRRFMMESCGLSGDKVRAVGLGEEALKDPNRPTSAINRRVELQIGS